MSQGLLRVLRRSNGERLHILALGAHADDIELGCAATLMYLKLNLKAAIHYVVFCRHFRHRKGRRRINRLKEMQSASRMLGRGTFETFDETDTEFPDRWRVIQENVETLCTDHRDRYKRPFDLVLAPRLDDNHQDHVVLAQAAAREAPYHARSLWHYEIKQTGRGGFEPNIFVDVGREVIGEKLWDDKVESDYAVFLQCWGHPEHVKKSARGKGNWKRETAKDTLAHRKVFLLHKCMKSQRNKASMNPELLLGVMRRRGMQASPQTPYAEAFVGRLTL